MSQPVAMGDLLHLGLFSLWISFPETVCPIVRLSLCSLLRHLSCILWSSQTEKSWDHFQKPFRCQSCQSHDSLRVVPNTFYGEGIPNLSGSFPWALYQRGICNNGENPFLFLLIIYTLFMNGSCVLQPSFKEPLNYKNKLFTCHVLLLQIDMIVVGNLGH